MNDLRTQAILQYALGIIHVDTLEMIAVQVALVEADCGHGGVYIEIHKGQITFIRREHNQHAPVEIPPDME